MKPNNNLFFVHHSGPEAFKRDAESRKQVRSHAMRDYRRRERSRNGGSYLNGMSQSTKKSTS